MLAARMINGKAHKEIKILFLSIFVNSRGGSNRIRIISLLRKEPLNLNQMSLTTGMDYKSISHHMNVLEKNNIISKSEEGYGHINYISPLLEANIEIFDEIVSIEKNSSSN